MPGDDDLWIDASGWHDGAPSAQPPVPAVPTREVLALCCPECSSLEVHHRPNGSSPQMTRWVCQGCNAAFKLPESESRNLVRAMILPR